MTKSELIKLLVDKYKHLYVKDVSRIVDVILEEMSTALEQGNRVELRGFGSFSIRERKAREARNPRTNEKVQLEDRKAIYFRAGKEVKDRLNDEDGSSSTQEAPAADSAPSYSEPSSFGQPTPEPSSGGFSSPSPFGSPSSSDDDDDSGPQGGGSPFDTNRF